MQNIRKNKAQKSRIPHSACLECYPEIGPYKQCSMDVVYARNITFPPSGKPVFSKALSQKSKKYTDIYFKFKINV